MKYRALLLDGLDLSAADFLKVNDVEVVVAKKMNPKELVSVLVQDGPYHFLGVRGATEVTLEVIEAGKDLLAIGRGGAGLNNIDVQAAAEHGVVVFNTPGANAESVAECVFGQVLTSLHMLSKGSIGLKKYRWLKKECEGQSLQGKTFGIVGFGFVGKWVSRITERIPGIKILSYDVNPAARLPWVDFVDLDEILGKSDIVSLHLPLTDSTQNIIDVDKLDCMKKG